MNKLSNLNNRSLIVSMLTIALTLIIILGVQLPTSAQQNDFVTVYPTANNDFFTNPGIGWQRMEHNNPPLLQEAVTYPTREDISWQVLNPSLGTYDWTILDGKMQRTVNNGQLFSFRIYTMQGESYGGHKVPQWVLNRDSSIIQGGDPNYSNCTYQTYWAMFVNELRLRYDGDPRIAFIDISGYGNFNEWSWTDDQTIWDDSFLSPASLDGQARIRLADMFIGGSSNDHNCQSSNGSQQAASYSYEGFQSTQLVMPYAGIQQSTRYVASRRSDVGIRYDCLGRDATLPKIDDVIEATWRTAPIVFEFCAESTTRSAVLDRAETLMNASHGVVVHENLEDPRDELPIERFMTHVGYRYQLTQAVYDSAVSAGSELSLSMAWQNVGTSPAYTSMGYDFALNVYLVDANGNQVLEYVSDANVTWWMPAHPLPGTAPTNSLGELIQIPSNLQNGAYELRVSIINTVNNQPINLAIEGDDGQGRYLIGEVTVSDGTGQPPATEEPTEEPSATEPPVTEEPATEEPATEEPTAEPSATEPPATEEPPATQEPPIVSSDYVYISDLEGQWWTTGSNSWASYIDIMIEDSNGRFPSGVTVMATWHDGTTFTCTTSGGWCGARLTGIPSSQNAAILTITSLSYASYSYNPSANNDGPTIVVALNEQATQEPVTQEPPVVVPPTEATTQPPIVIITTQIPTTVPPVVQPPVTQEPPVVVPPPAGQPPVTSDYVYVADMDAQQWGQGGGLWTSYIDIEIRDSNGRSPSGVTITGVWQDGTVYTCTTSGGWCGARLTDIPRSVGTATLTITNLSHSSFSYNASANSSTSISISR